ncbi:hypothetical protein D3C76_1021300 [compost metagenome]
MAIQRISILRRAGLFPLQIIFLRGFDSAVTQALAVVACHEQLLGGEKVANEILFLVIEVLPDPLTNRDGGSLELNHP